MTFVFPANVKNSISVSRRVYTELSRFVFVVNVLFYFILFFVQDFFKNSINR